MRSIRLLFCLIGTALSGAGIQPVIGQDETSPKPEVLDLLLKETPKPDYDAPVPNQICGRVVLHAGQKTSGLAGVSVTDGYSVVKTNADGAYVLKPAADAVFVYTTRPAGYDVQGHWYKPLADQVDFDLRAADHDENKYIFVHVTDTHVSQNLRSLEGLSRFVREVNALKPKPRFVVNSGDLLSLHKALISSPDSGHRDFRNYVGIMNHLAMPHYNVAGDHTDSSYRLNQFPRGDHRCGKPLYWEYLGPHFFSFEYGRIHFVSVDFGYHLGRRQILVKGKNLEYPTNEVQPVHIEWLKQDMARRTPGSFVVTTSEADLGDHCPGFAEIARQNDVRLQLVGDIHVVSHKARSVPYRSGGALAGCWWNAKTEQLCPDLSPQGYLIYRVVGEKLEHFYKGLGQRVAITSHRVGAPLQGRVTFQAHLVQPSPDESLEYSLNGEDWSPMREVGRPFYRAAFQATVDTASLADGLFTFHVRSTSGEVRTREFVVANQRDSSQFKTDAELTFSVGYDTGWTKHKAPTDKVDVLFNGQVTGTLDPNTRKEYSLTIPASRLRSANVLSFRFVQPKDGMSLSSPVLSFKEATFRDPRDTAIRRIRTAHWGQESEDWGGFIAGAAAPPDETPFHRKQNSFCFVLNPTQSPDIHADAEKGLPSGVQVTQYAPKSASFPGCTHIAFSGKTEIVTAGDRLFYRTDSQSPFRESAIKGLKDAHSVVFNPHDRLFYATDTGNHRLITFRDPASSQVQNRLTSLAETKLKRPHDIVFDQSTGWLYSLNPDSTQVFRFKTAGKTADVLDLSRHLGYSRALTVVNGRLYVIGSSIGAVVEVIDFGKQEYKIHNSFEKKKDAPAGSWKSTGLVLNDVDFFQGHWYATSYFCPTYAGHQNYDENKFIRFQTWQDLKEGTWDDLSRFLPSKVVPYYLTPGEGALFIAVFNHEHPGTFDKVYRLTISE